MPHLWWCQLPCIAPDDGPWWQQDSIRRQTVYALFGRQLWRQRPRLYRSLIQVGKAKVLIMCCESFAMWLLVREWARVGARKNRPHHLWVQKGQTNLIAAGRFRTISECKKVKWIWSHQVECAPPLSAKRSNEFDCGARHLWVQKGQINLITAGVFPHLLSAKRSNEFDYSR